jgi:hypothetical protein
MGIEIGDVDRLINRDCKNIISGVIKNKNIGFNKARVRPQRDIFWLNAGDISKATAGNRQYHVIPFLGLDSGLTYWLAVGIQVDIIKGVYQFHDASLFIFEGTALNEKKTPILRAEWGLSEDGLHAQPHWHVYPSYLNNEITPFLELGKIETAEFNPEIAEEDVDDSLQEDEESRLPKFHFAMGSHWHVNGQGAHVVKFSEKGLVNWLGGCLHYIKNQLVYMIE